MEKPRTYRHPDDPQEMAARIRAARAWAGMMQKELAAAIGRSVSTVERIEKGDASAIGKTPERRARLRLEVAKATGAWIGFFLAPWGEEERRPADPGEHRDLLTELDEEARESLQAQGVELTWDAIAKEVLAIAMRRAQSEAPPTSRPEDEAEAEVDLDRLLPDDEDADEAQSGLA